MSVRAVIVAAGGANFGSLVEACRRVGVDADVGADAARIGAATHVILPGVGAAAQAMRALRERGLDRVLSALTQPLLGICLGMQLLFDASTEVDANATAANDDARIGRDRADVHGADGHAAHASVAAAPRVDCLGLLRGEVRRLPPAPSWPHMGWNRFDAITAHALLDGVDRADWFYFVHGYAAPADEQALATTTHGWPFAAVVGRGNVFGTQFHPEKSAAAGRRVLANFFALT